jgi:hypothetical protein
MLTGEGQIAVCYHFLAISRTSPKYFHFQAFAFDYSCNSRIADKGHLSWHQMANLTVKLYSSSLILTQSAV